MWSVEPIPGNPWPRDMVITIEDSPHTLHELLWVREAWDLRVAGPDLPPLLTDTPALIDGDRPVSITEWQEAWPGLWHSCLAHAGIIHNPSVLDRLDNGALETDERASLLEQLNGPSWRDRFHDEALTPAYDEWSRSRFEAHWPPRPTHYGETPERMSLDALIPAWRAGLTKLVLIPCRGTFTRRIGQSALLLTEGTRNDPTRYAEALKSVA